MSRHFDNKRVWSREGVSEVVGTILILAITVVLFSGVILMVGNIPTPEQNVNTSLQGSIKAVNDDWTQGAWVNISNKGGIVLKGAWTDIIIVLNTTSTHHRTQNLAATPHYGLNDSAGASDSDGDANWETGETWHYIIPAGEMDDSTLVSVMLIAEDRSAIIWSADLRPAGERNYPPVIMSTGVSSILAQLDVGYLQYGEDFDVITRIIDFDENLDTSTVWADLSSYGLPPLHLTDADMDGEFTGTATAPYDEAVYPRGGHPVTINATDFDGAYTEKTFYPSIGGDYAGMSMLSIVTDDITFSDDVLVHNKKVEITALVDNFGVGGICSVNFYDNGVKNVTNLIKSVGGVGVPSNGYSDVIISWTPSYGGEHTLIVEVVPTPPTIDGDLTNNEAWINVTVQPTILLVDDDGHSNDRTDADTSSFMRGALSAGNFEYDFVSIAVGDGPQYATGENKMVNYDVVIWMTGYATSGTLTNSDVTNLKKYLEVSSNAGSLWLIGQGVLAEAIPATPLHTFIQTNLGVDNNVWANRNPMASNLTCTTPADLVTGYLSGGSIDIVQRGVMPVNGYAITDSSSASSFRSLVDGATGVDCYGVGFSVDAIESRTYFTPWEFSRIKETSDQAQLAYQVIRWLGDINTSFGRDLSISEQSMNKDVVYYRQQVEISGIVRNNGMRNETSTVKLYVYYNGVPLNLNTTTEIPVNVSNTVGSNWVSVGPFYWYPEYIGFHSIVLKVDPNNDIAESNEDNNVVSNYLASGTINVQFRLLVVDDDESANNGGGLSNETSFVRDACVNLGYFNESRVVNASEPGPDRSYLQDFNAVIWSTGDANGAFRPEDIANLTSYLNNGGMLWVVGRSPLSLLPTPAEQMFQRNMTGVAVATTQANPATLLGVDDDEVSHGISYRMNAGLCQELTPVAGVSGAFHRTASTFNGLSVNISGFKTVTTAFSLSDLNGSAEFPGDAHARMELAYLVLHWFGLPDYRVELRMTDPDFTSTEDRPQLGDSYVLQAQVHNVGDVDGNALVRFMDGTTQIGSDSISVSANAYTTAEVIWTPLFAGYRTLHVLVDPINETGEIIEWFNNQISYTTYVYFFYDDMEGGTGKWQHDSTIALINGEQPLDYISNTVVTMNITKSWDSSFSESVVNCTDVGFYHTFDTSYWLQEPSGSATITSGRSPIDVVFALDNSGSMDQTDIDNLVDAAQNFIGQMNDNDRVAIWTYGDGTYDYPYDDDSQDNIDPTLLRDWAYMTFANRASFNASLNTLDDVIGGTPFYDTLGEAIRKALEFDPAASDSTRLEYVIGMTDGESNNDEAWTPNRNWGTTGYETDYGQDKTKQGLLYPPCMVYTIGLGIDHDDGDGGWTYPTAPGWSHIPPHDGTPAVEYDLWAAADTSPSPTHDGGGVYGENLTTHDDNIGHYYYTTDSSQLPSIFDDIFTSIIIPNVPGGNITRTDDPQPTSVVTPSPSTRSGGDGLLSLPEPPGVMATIWSDGFETGNFNGWDGAPAADWAVRSGSDTDYGGQDVDTHGGTYCADARDSDGADNYLYKTVNLAGHTGVSLSFWWDAQDIENNDERPYLSIWDGAAYTDVWNTGINDNGDWQTDGPGDWAQATVDLSGYNMIDGFILRFTAPGPMDSNEGGGTYRDEFLLDDVLLTGNVPIAPWIVSTVPADGAIDVAETQDIVITFSEPMNTGTLVWNIAPNPGGWSAVWSGGNTIVTLSHFVDFAQSTTYTVTVNDCRDLSGASILPYVLVVSTGFESGTFDGWYTGGGGTWDWNIVTDRAIGTYSARSEGDGYSWLGMDNMDFSSVTDGVLTFYTQSYGTENGEDTLQVSVSTNDWGTWDTLLDIDGDTVDEATSVWHLYTIDLSAYDGQPDVDLSFDVDCDSNTQEYYWIDDIKISSDNAPNPWSFTTTGPPSITATTPADGAVDVLLTQPVVIDFNKAMNTGSLTYTCVPDPGGWAAVWSGGNTRVTLTHTNFAAITVYTFTVTQALDLGGLNIVAGPVPNPWSFTTIIDNPPTITVTNPANNAIGVAVTQNIVITFSEAMNTGTVTYTINPNPGGLGVAWSGGNTVLTITHNNFAQGTLYTVQVTAGQDTTGNNLIAGAAPNPWSFRTVDVTPPTITLTVPSDGSTGVGLGQPVIVTFSEAMNTASAEAAFSCSPNPGGWTFSWNSLDTEMTAYHDDFSASTLHTCTVASSAEDLSGNNLAAGTKPNPWSFTSGVSGGSSNPGLSPSGPNSNKSAVTQSMNLTNIDSADLSFWHKYNIVPGANGGVLLVGYMERDLNPSLQASWKWKYVVPSSAYTGNLRLNQTGRTDSFGTFIQWGWNGVSGRGTFAWEKVGVDLLDWVPDGVNASAANYEYRSNVRVKFQYYQYGGGTGYGWYIDDVKVAVSRADETAVNAASADAWQLVNRTWASPLGTHSAHSGDWAWWNGNVTTGGYMKKGIDNSLICGPIDLTNARNATLGAFFKFNINTKDGAPPDGFRVEISKDNGLTWSAINLGVRAAWNVSGTETDASDGKVDGKSYTGISSGSYWVPAGTLTRLNVDLSAFTGNAIMLRFRVVTNANPAYLAFKSTTVGFGGFYIDDVTVMGNTILG